MKTWMLALAALTLGCSAPDVGPGLLQLTELSVREVGRGDTLEIVGAGFPEGRAARLTFRGDIFRPGRPARHDVEMSIPARTSTPHVLEATIPEELIDDFCGHDDGAHATFRGDVTAAFAPRKSGAPPVAGSLQGIVLDLQPSHETEEDRALASAEGERFARFLGVSLSADGAAPLRVQKLEPEGRAAQVGLAPGDVIEELAGVRVQEVADFVPPPRARAARIGLHRGSSNERALVAVDIAEFKPGTLSDLAPALALVCSAILALLLALSPLSRFCTWLALTVSKRSRAVYGQQPRRFLVVTRGLSGALPSNVATYLGVGLGSSVLALVAFGVPLVARELDLPILLLASASALMVAGFLSQLRAQGRVAPTAAVRRALWILVAQLPVASALLVAVTGLGSLRADDFAAAQTGMPWRFLAFSSPAHFVALLAGILALVPEATSTWPASSCLPVPLDKRRPTLTAVEWAHLVVSAGLLCIVMLGGFAVPWFSEFDRTAASSRLALGAALLVLKTFAVVLLVATLRWSIGRVNVEQCGTALLRVGLPLSVALPVLAQLWTWGAQGLLLAAYRGVIAVALFTAVTVGCGLVARRLGQSVRLQRGEPGVNPWL